MMKRRRLFFIAHYFPPVGGAAVQRPAKFVKFLGDFGWDVTVLTVANPSAPVMDQSLLDEVPAGVKVFGAPTWEPGYAVKAAATAAGGQRGVMRHFLRRTATTLLQPDPQVLWWWGARKAARRLLRDVQHDVIMVTAPPHSATLLARALAQEFALPLIVDFRDEWDLSRAYLENRARGWWVTRLQAAMQRTVLRTAATVIATTPRSAKRLSDLSRQAGGSGDAVCICNGWDRDDLPQETTGPSTARPLGKFRVVHAGTLWNLTSVAPLAVALQRLDSERPDLAERLELVLAGRKTPAQEALVAGMAGGRATVLSRAYLPHDEAVELIREADALLLLLSAVPGAERVIPGKLFEYLAAGRPILGVAPDGDAASLLREAAPDAWRAPEDEAGICEWLATRIAAAGTLGRIDLARPDPTVALQFERRELTRQLARVLERAAEAASNDLVVTDRP